MQHCVVLLIGILEHGVAHVNEILVRYGYTSIELPPNLLLLT